MMLGTFSVFSQIVYSGVVLDAESEAPIAGALVELHEYGRNAITNEEGRFSFDGLQPGPCHVHIFMLGYSPVLLDVFLGEPAQEAIFMKPSVLELREAVIEDSWLKSDNANRSLAVTGMGSAELLRSGSSNLAQSLSRLPGVRMQSLGAGIGRPVIRGFSGNRIVVNDQGTRQEGQQWGSDHGLEIDPFSAERVEVIKGPASLIHGPDGMAGVVNILPPALPAAGTLRSSALFHAQSNNTTVGGSVMTEGNNGRFFSRIRFGYRESGDLQVPADSFLYIGRKLPIEQGYLSNTAVAEHSVSGIAGRIWGGGIVRLSGSYFSQSSGLFPGIFGIPTAESIANDGNSRNIGTPRSSVAHAKMSVNMNLNRSNGWLEGDFAWQGNIRKEIAFPHSHGGEPLPGNKEALRLNLHTFSASLRRHFNAAGGAKWVFGTVARQMSSVSSGWEFLVSSYRRSEIGLFAHMEKKLLETFVLNAGLRYDLLGFEADSFSELRWNDSMPIGFFERVPAVNEVYGGFSSAFGVSWRVAERHLLKLNLGKSFRAPAAPELVSNGVHHGTFRHEQGDTQLRPEHGYQVDLSWRWQGKYNVLEVNPFVGYYQNFIYLRPAGEFSFLPEGGQVYRFTQHNAVSAGFEVFADYHPTSRMHVEVIADAVWNYNLTTGLPLPFSPPLRSILNLRYDIKPSKGMVLSPGINATMVADQSLTDRNELPTSGYTLIGLELGLQQDAPDKLSVHFRVENLLDEVWYDHLSRYRLIGLPMQGRNFIINVRIPLTLKKP